MKLKAIGYPFYQTQLGLFNPTVNVVQNAKNKLINLLYTNIGQRLLAHNCKFGIDLTKLLFENMPYTDGDVKIKKQIQKSIKRWIPQIENVEVGIEQQENFYVVNLRFSVNEQWGTLILEIDLNER